MYGSITFIIKFDPYFFLKQFVIPLPHIYHKLTGKYHCHKSEFWYNRICKQFENFQQP